jgi:hypothetical protein
MRHFPRLPHAVVALAATAALLAAGCGGATSDKNDYVKSLNKAVATLQHSLSGLGQDIGSGGVGPQMASKLEASGAAMDKAAGAFKGITPPSDAKQAHAKIVDGLHKLGGLFRDAAKAARAKDLSALSKTLTSFETSPGVQEIQQAQDDLKAHGYKVAGS